MEQQDRKAISELIEEAKKTNKTIVLIGAPTDKESRLLAQSESILKGQDFAIINVNSLSSKEILEEARNLPEGRGVVIIEDIEGRIIKERRENLVFKIEAVKHELIETFILPEKKEYGVSKNKKSFSPPKFKGHGSMQLKFQLRGKHR